MHKAYDEARSAQTTKENDILNAALLPAIKNWRGDGLPAFSPDSFDEQVTFETKYSLLLELNYAVGIGEREKKASRLQRKSDAASSASNATASA
jgi:hypothetical protein